MYLEISNDGNQATVTIVFGPGESEQLEAGGFLGVAAHPSALEALRQLTAALVAIDGGRTPYDRLSHEIRVADRLMAAARASRDAVAELTRYLDLAGGVAGLDVAQEQLVTLRDFLDRVDPNDPGPGESVAARAVRLIEHYRGVKERA